MGNKSQNFFQTTTYIQKNWKYCEIICNEAKVTVMHNLISLYGIRQILISCDGLFNKGERMDGGGWANKVGMCIQMPKGWQSTLHGHLMKK